MLLHKDDEFLKDEQELYFDFERQKFSNSMESHSTRMII